MKINFVRMNNVIKADRNTELIDTALRTDLAWLAKEYRRIANMLNSCDLTNDMCVKLAEVGVGNTNLTYCGKEALRDHLAKICICLSDTYRTHANENGSQRGYRRAMFRCDYDIVQWDMTELDPEVA